MNDDLASFLTPLGMPVSKRDLYYEIYDMPPNPAYFTTWVSEVIISDTGDKTIRMFKEISG